MTIEQLKQKYAAISAKAKQPKHSQSSTKPDHPESPPPKPGSLTEVERAILLRGIVDVLRSKGIEFNVWHKHGLSRVYFIDNSWLSYAPSGAALYGPDKESLAFEYRTKFKLGSVAKREEVAAPSPAA